MFIVCVQGVGLRCSESSLPHFALQYPSRLLGTTFGKVGNLIQATLSSHYTKQLHSIGMAEKYKDDTIPAMIEIWHALQAPPLPPQKSRKPCLSSLSCGPRRLACSAVARGSERKRPSSRPPPRRAFHLHIFFGALFGDDSWNPGCLGFGVQPEHSSFHGLVSQ